MKNILEGLKHPLEASFGEIIDLWEQYESYYPEEDVQKRLGAIRLLCYIDRYYLLVKMCGRVDMLHPWVYARCREVEKDPYGYLDIWGREHYKSTIITFGGCLQEILKNPEVTIGLFSHTKSIAKDFLNQIKRELENNEKLKLCFPDVLYQAPEKEAPTWSLDAGIIVRRKGNPKESTVEANGLVEGMPTGKHYEILLYDDVVTKDSVSTPDQIQKTTEAWELSDNLGQMGGKKIMAGTRYSFADTYQEIMNRGAAIPRIYPATDDGTIQGNPVLFTREAWKRKVMAQGEATISCQMLANPLAGQQRMFNVDELNEYEVRPATLNVYILCDPARSKKKDSANTAMIVWGVDYAGNKYLLDGFDEKMDLMERWQALARLWMRWSRETGVRHVRVGYESFGAQADMDYFKEQQRLTKVHFEIEELAWPREGGGSKEDRVQRLVPDVREGKLFLPYPTDDNRLTSNQRNMKNSGYDYRIARPIKRKDESGNIYDLAANLKMQMHFFPFGNRKDLVDAASRIYDIEPKAPSANEPNYLEPNFI
jgi:hypothetical protein